MKILFLKHAPDNREPWVSDALAAIDGRHEVIEFNESGSIPAQFRGIDVVIDQGGVHGTRAMADECSGLKLWQILGTGFDKLDLAYWELKGIAVANTPGQYSAVALAECALMYMIMLARRWHVTQANMRRGQFYNTFGAELLDRRLLLFGFGASARELAIRARAFGMKISGIDIIDIDGAMRREYGLESAGTPDDLDRMLRQCDFLSLHLHLNEDTRRIIDRRRLGLMKPDAFLINVARGALVDEGALHEALAGGRLAGAGLDVFASEPMDPDNPLLKLPNVVATPHISGATYGTSRRRAACVAENIERIAAGLEPLYRVDKFAAQPILSPRP
jgi:phosphoglycerate dehydrogenase-like enzyme